MEGSKEKKPILIIDNGAGSIKIGLNKSENPTVIQNLIGRAKGETGKATSASSNFLIGNDAIEKKKSVELEFVIENGNIKNWDIMEKVWDHCFKKELKINPKDCIVILTERNHNKNVREKMAKIFFESFGVPGLYISDTSVLTLYSIGSYTGLVVDSGECSSQIVPYSDGTYFPFSSQIVGVDGRLLTNYLRENLGGGKLKNVIDFQQAKELKELFCNVALHFNEEINFIEKMEYELPDGKQIFLEKERLLCCELLFNPGYDSKTYSDFGFGEGCYKAIDSSAIDIRKSLYSNIVLSGGTTLFNGFAERLELEIQELAPPAIKNIIKIISTPDRLNLPWTGAKALSALSKFHSLYITKKEYQESGSAIVKKKCP